MQSLFQFRRAGLAVQAQIDRDLEKAQFITSDRSAGGNSAGAAAAAADDSRRHASNSAAFPSDGEKDASDPVGPEPSSSRSSSVESGEVETEVEIERPAERVETTRTRYTEHTALGLVLTGVDVRDRAAHEGGDGRIFVVGWEGPKDPHNPRNWSYLRRVLVTLQISLIGILVTASSGIEATALPQAAADLGVSEVAESLATGLFLVGMGVGSLIAGPFSETFGRNVVYIVSLLVFMIWILASALAPNFGAQIAFRFLAGCSGSTPLVCAGGSVSDMYDSVEKTWAFPVYAITSFGGPMLGAIMGAYIGPSAAVSWRWVEWTILIFAGLVLAVVLLCMPETYPPLLLKWKAQHLRRVTGDSRFRAEHEIIDATLLSRLRISMTRPFQMLTEPIIIAFTVYLSVVYIVLFTFLVGWPDVFEHTYDGLGQGLGNVTFAAMLAGTLSTFALVPAVYRLTMRQIARAEAKGEGHIFNPEIRLWYSMLGPALGIPVSLFWMAWTDYAQVSIWSPIVAAALFGFSITGIFLSAYMYIIDSYEVFSASALTFVALIRYLAAGGMTVVGVPFYANMGTHYTITILACISTLMVPIPFGLYKFGYRLRLKSKYAVSREI
ncbi:hypothetical protein SLS62_010704 [Diatrype stigma]|uniref:Major facilitator superfamily (MFS) profile domain-containing protein n=1 Tax=Diatrype stigma TaxID=117547 RepID=A0AAN9YHI0_9PEZI